MKISMLKIIKLTIFTSIFLLVSCTGTIKSGSTYPAATDSCNSAPWCNFKGIKHDWPSLSADQELVPFTNLTFIVELPRNFDRVSILWGKLPMFAAQYKKNKIAVSVEEIFPIDLRAENVETTKNSGSTRPIDVFETIFTMTPADPEPQNEYDQALWRTAFMIKTKQFKAASSASFYKTGPSSAYTANVDAVTHNRITVITHNEIPERYLVIRDNAPNRGIIENIIATIKLDR